MATQVSLNDGAVASAGALAIQTNGTTQAVSISTGQVATLAQNPILTSGTANGVAYLNGSKVLTTGSALVFDGTNLGVGTASPSTYSAYTKLSVLNGIAMATNTTDGGALVGATTTGTELAYLSMGRAYSLGSTGEIALATNGAKPIIFGTSNTERMRITDTSLYTASNINVAIGHSNPAYKLDVQTTATGTAAGDNTVAFFGSLASGRDANIRFGDSVNASARIGYLSGSLYFYTNGANRATIDTSGNLLVGKTSFSALSGVGTGVTSVGRINVVTAESTSAFSTYELYSTGAGAYRFYVDASGTISATSAVITPITSDERLKQNIVDYSNGLSQVLGLRPRYFEYKKEPGRKLAGFISQEVQTVMPEAIVPTREDPEMMTYSIDWYPLFVKAIQEQQALITQLTARITALEGA
jgi:hypothetical protein